MFTVAPSGSVKLAVFLLTPALSCTQRMVTGRVADELEVEKAVSSAVFIALKCSMGLTFPMIFKSIGRTTNICRANAMRTVKK